MLKNQKVKQARKAAGLTQTELGEKLGTNQAYISALETRSNFSLETAIDLAKILKVDPKELMVDEAGQSIEVSKEEMVNNVLAFLKKKGKPVTDLIKEMGISRTAFYYQIKSDNMKQSFKDSFKKATGFNIIDIVNEKTF
jgi:transcriptional regulator with XRE-family HTH domain